MKNLFLLLTFSLFSFSAFAQNDLSGQWNTGDQNTIIKIEQQNGVYIGRVVSSDNPKAKSGTLIMKDVKAKKNSFAGKLYSAKRGEWYDAEISENSDKLKIKISVGFFSKTLEWVKVQS